MRGAAAWAAGAVLLAAAAWLRPAIRSQALPLAQVRLEGPGAIQDLGFIGLGMRRQAADLHFIRLLQYYGTQEEGAEEEKGHSGHDHAGPPHRGFEGGVYAEVLPRTLHILELDPYFRYAVLYSAAALAYNLNRPDQAVELLNAALRRDPKAWRYHLYIAAIAYRREREFGKLVAILEPALSDPDCPAMLKTILAGIHQKLGNKERAIALYRDIERTSRDPEYQRLARERLEKLLPAR